MSWYFISSGNINVYLYQKEYRRNFTFKIIFQIYGFFVHRFNNPLTYIHLHKKNQRTAVKISRDVIASLSGCFHGVTFFISPLLNFHISSKALLYGIEYILNVTKQQLFFHVDNICYQYQFYLNKIGEKYTKKLKEKNYFLCFT